MSKNQGGESSKLVPVQIDASALPLMGTNLAIGGKCSLCVHYKNIAHPSYESVCSELGIIPESIPCKKYTSDYRQLLLAEEPWFAAFAAAISEMNSTQLRIMASLLIKEQRTRKHGLMFGESVFLRVFSGDYLSNYRRGVVISATSKYVYIEGKDGFHAMVFKSSILNTKQWMKKKAELIKTDRLKDPFIRKHMEAPTAIDKRIREAIEEDKLAWIEQQTMEITGIASKEKNKPNKGKAKNPRYMTLVEFFNRHDFSNAGEVGTVRTRSSS